ncbi:MAG: ABC transporter ATP-binding protein [Rhodobacteraceae bacterium]|nr:ABC transporter ATP-binding protein [Paracoccaceae bacterium]
MRAELKGVLAASKTTTIYVTHDQVEAMSLADRIAVMHGGDIVQADRPVEVYRNPAARFVGSFIGNPPMNFLPAAALAEGRWQVAGHDFAGPRVAAPQIEFAIRPEDLHPAEQGLAAEVRVVEPLGPHTLITATVAGVVLRAVLDSTLAVAPGDQITLAPVADRIRWFDLASQKAIA